MTQPQFLVWQPFFVSVASFFLFEEILEASERIFPLGHSDLIQARERAGLARQSAAIDFWNGAAGDKTVMAKALELQTMAWSNLQGVYGEGHLRSLGAGFLVAVPEQELELTLTPVTEDQELCMILDICYWEGAIEVSGTRGGAPVSGRGYVELTGYH